MFHFKTLEETVGSKSLYFGENFLPKKNLNLFQLKNCWSSKILGKNFLFKFKKFEESSMNLKGFH